MRHFIRWKFVQQIKQRLCSFSAKTLRYGSHIHEVVRLNHERPWAQNRAFIGRSYFDFEQMQRYRKTKNLFDCRHRFSEIFVPFGNIILNPNFKCSVFVNPDEVLFFGIVTQNNYPHEGFFFGNWNGRILQWIRFGNEIGDFYWGVSFVKNFDAISDNFQTCWINIIRILFTVNTLRCFSKTVNLKLLARSHAVFLKNEGNSGKKCRELNVLFCRNFQKKSLQKFEQFFHFLILRGIGLFMNFLDFTVKEFAEFGVFHRYI